jgi:hypothetical protein
VAKRRGTSEGTASEPRWPHLLSVGLLVGSISGALILGAAFKSDAPSGEQLGVGHPVPQPVHDTRPSPTAPSPLEASLVEGGLAERATLRAERDLERVSETPGSWTAQLALLCDADRVGQIVDEFGAEPELYILPAYHDGKACFLVCWGLFDHIDGARTADGLPSALRSALSDPYPKRLTDVFEGLQ